ncbi:hypothetical protein [Methanolobus chelungpuianus]|uniref:hypothetical protein n=1 Tax=Methanolobus chelungpuianus TaxID=502115 RepID=UPI002113B62A|nr:hypothetical protein [Methanolobus chelungpuianus]
MKQQKASRSIYPGHSLKLCGILSCSILIALLLISAASASTTISSVTPANPAVGDEIVIKGYGTPDSVLNAYTSFTVEVPVREGKYEYELKNIKVPAGTDTFSVDAEKVTLLKVEVKKLGIPYSRSAIADSAGLASISQSYVLPFTYKVAITGEATEAEVNLTLKGLSKVRTDSTGYFECSYKTNGVPAGLFVVDIDGEIIEIELREKKAEKEKRSGKTGTELTIVQASELGKRSELQAPEEDAGPEDTEEELAAPQENIQPVEGNVSLLEAQPKPGPFQSIVNWLKGLFK